GLLHIAASADEAAQLPTLEQLFCERRDTGFTHIGDLSQLTGDEARERFPALGPTIAGALATSAAARVDGRLLRDALRRAAQHRGARIVTGDATLMHAPNGGRAEAIVVGNERWSAAAIVVTGGAWSGALGEALGTPLPVFPQRGQILHLELPNT